MTTITNTDYDKQRHGEGEHFTELVGMETSTDTLKISLQVSQKTKIMIYHMTQIYHWVYIQGSQYPTSEILGHLCSLLLYSR